MNKMEPVEDAQDKCDFTKMEHESQVKFIIVPKSIVHNHKMTYFYDILPL